MNNDSYFELKNICKNKGYFLVDFIRPILIKAIDNENEKIKAKRIKKKLKRIDISDVISESKYNELKDICNNYGISINAYVKIKIAEELLKYPDYLKNEMK